MLISKKSQAALEFIMTYGWAILVVLVAIGALAYFGVLSPDRFLPSRCTLQSGLACVDHSARPTSLSVVIKNSLGYDIIIDSFKAEQCTAASGQDIIDQSSGLSDTGGLANSNSATLNLVCSNSGAKFNGKINITYTNTETSIQHTNQGSLTSKLE